MKTVLYLDPSDKWARDFRRQLEGEYAFFWVTSPDMAKTTITNRRRVDLVVIGLFEGQPTLDFISWLHEIQFSGPILTTTQEFGMDPRLMEQRCIQVFPKDSLPSAMRRYLPGNA